MVWLLDPSCLQPKTGRKTHHLNTTMPRSPNIQDASILLLRYECAIRSLPFAVLTDRRLGIVSMGRTDMLLLEEIPAYHLGCTKLLLSILGYTNIFKGGAKWFLKSVNSPSFRVRLVHLWRCWYLVTGDRRITEPSTVGWQVITRKFWMQDFSKIHGNPFDSVETARIGCHLQGEIHAVCSWSLWTWLKKLPGDFFREKLLGGHFWVDHLSHISQVWSEMCGLPCISVLKTQGFFALRRPNLRK